VKNRYRFDSPGSYEKIVSIHQINEEARFDSTIPEQSAALQMDWDNHRGLPCALIHAN